MWLSKIPTVLWGIACHSSGQLIKTPGGNQCLPYWTQWGQCPPAVTAALPQNKGTISYGLVTELHQQALRGMLITPYRKGRMFCLNFFRNRQASQPKKSVLKSLATQGRIDKNQYQIPLSWQTTINKLPQLSRCLSPLESWNRRNMGHGIFVEAFSPAPLLLQFPFGME